MTGKVALIVGGDGLIARRLHHALEAAGWQVAATGRHAGATGRIMLDLAQPIDPDTLSGPVDAVYLMAGATRLAACEADPRGTALVNVEAPARLAHSFTARGARVVAMSSDLVFDGTEPWCAADRACSPTSEYGRQKRALEEALLSLQPPAAILRITKVSESLLPLLAEWSLALRSGAAISCYADQVCAPVALDDVVAQLIGMADPALPPGIAQLGGPCDVSYLDLGRALARHLGVDPSLVLSAASPRPVRYSTLQPWNLAPGIAAMQGDADMAIADVLGLLDRQ